jgi:hypothetical protein
MSADLTKVCEVNISNSLVFAEITIDVGTWVDFLIVLLWASFLQVRWGTFSHACSSGLCDTIIPVEISCQIYQRYSVIQVIWVYIDHNYLRRVDYSCICSIIVCRWKSFCDMLQLSLWRTGSKIEPGMFARQCEQTVAARGRSCWLVDVQRLACATDNTGQQNAKYEGRLEPNGFTHSYCNGQTNQAIVLNAVSSFT